MSLLSLIQPAIEALAVEPESLQIASVQALTKRYYPNLSADRPALVGPLSDGAQCAQLGALLRTAYPDAHRVQIISDLETDRPSVQSVSLGQLEQVAPGEGMWLLYLPPLQCPGAVETFLDVVAHLRAPDGCPWDREQTHRSLRQGFQEEAYEVLDALDREDVESLKEELGDILLHVVLQSQIASELGEFRLGDVVCRVYNKIVHRHPHVFGGLDVNGVDEIVVNWEKLKRQEKQTSKKAPSALDGISPAMPALARAQSVQRRANRMEAETETAKGLAARVAERVSYLSGAVDPAVREAVLGDLFYDLAHLAQGLGVDAESALRMANSRYERRFRATEKVSQEI